MCEYLCVYEYMYVLYLTQEFQSFEELFDLGGIAFGRADEADGLVEQSQISRVKVIQHILNLFP